MKVGVGNVSGDHSDQNVVHHEEQFQPLFDTWPKEAAINNEGKSNQAIQGNNYIEQGEICVSSFIYYTNLTPNIIRILTLFHRFCNSVGESSCLKEKENEVDYRNCSCENNNDDEADNASL